MRRVKLTKQEKAIENALLRGEYRSVSKSKFNSIAKAIAARKKNATSNIRVNGKDLAGIRQKARR